MQQPYPLQRQRPGAASFTDGTSHANDVRPNLGELLQVPVGNTARNGEPCPATRSLPAQ